MDYQYHKTQVAVPLNRIVFFMKYINYSMGPEYLGSVMEIALTVA